MPKKTSKKVMAAAMRSKGLAKKPKRSSAKKPPSATSKQDALFAVIAEGIDGKTAAGRRKLALLRKVRADGLPLRWLMAYEMRRLLDVQEAMEAEDEAKRIDPAKGHVQLDKITDRLKQLVVEESAPDETVPGDVRFTVPLPVTEDSGPGDKIRVVSARDVRAQRQAEAEGATA